MRTQFITFLLVIAPMLSLAQNFSSRTNGLELSFDDEGMKTKLPTIDWVSPRLETVQTTDLTINIQADIASAIPLQSVVLEIVYPDNTSIKKAYQLDSESTRYQVNQVLKLVEGEYKVIVKVANVDGGAVSDFRNVLIGLETIGSAVSMNRKDRAILFATDKYDYWDDLVNPIYDAYTIGDILKNEYGFDVTIVENTENDDVFNKIADLSQMSYNPQDQLFIFFAGHGYFDETFGEGYVVAKNSLENDRARTSYISHNRLRSILDNIPCEHILLTMDVCFGGTFDPKIANSRALLKTSITDESEYLARKLSYTTRKYITSGGKNYVSDGIIGEHSPFARQLIKALKSGAGSDRILTIAEIRPFIEKLVPEPRLGSFGRDHNASDFVFVRKLN